MNYSNGDCRIRPPMTNRKESEKLAERFEAKARRYRDVAFAAKEHPKFWTSAAEQYEEWAADIRNELAEMDGREKRAGL